MELLNAIAIRSSEAWGLAEAFTSVVKAMGPALAARAATLTRALGDKDPLALDRAIDLAERVLDLPAMRAAG